MTTAGTDTKTLGQKAVDRFTEMMIERMEQMKSVGWRKGWIGGATAPGAMPQNVSGRGYSGSNSFFLQLDTALRGYSMPVYLTFKQANDLGAHVKKGESAMPVLYWDIMARDKDGHKITKEAYRKMSLAERMQVQTIPFLKAYNVFNIDQTNLTEVKPNKVEALRKLFAPLELRDAEGMFTSKALDRMFEKQEWICPIQYDKQVPGAQANYEAGIRASFAEARAGVAESLYSTANDNTYITTGNVAWNSAASTDAKLKKIITQKWIALYPDGNEAWAEFKRTGYPELMPVYKSDNPDINPAAGQFVKKLRYPDAERRDNPHATESTLNGGKGDGMNVRVWWDVRGL